ncbi:MAG: hypothetical protein LQ342_006960 [Letrouitia transgressa]|nr:MAG: hypothetical protein LQ342_006960 [Letrouitia transgressa]
MQKTLALSLLFLSLTGSSLGCDVVSGVKFTAYGFPDASGTPAYKCNGNRVVQTQPGDKTMLGDGSFNKPYAAAAAGGSIFKKCELLYIPLLKKYFRVQDDCSGCDLYVVQANRDIGQSGCERQFGTFQYGHPLHEVIRSPGSGFQTNTQPLFANHKCYNKPSDGRVFPNRDGHVQCGSNGQEEFVAEDVDGNADEEVLPPNPTDDDPAARHNNMKSATSVVPEPAATRRAFKA